MVLLLVLEASADPHVARLLGWTELGHGTATGDTVRIGQLVLPGNSAANLSGPVQAFYCPEDIELAPQAPVSGIVRFDLAHFFGHTFDYDYAAAG